MRVMFHCVLCVHTATKICITDMSVSSSEIACHLFLTMCFPPLSSETVHVMQRPAVAFHQKEARLKRGIDAQYSEEWRNI